MDHEPSRGPASCSVRVRSLAVSIALVAGLAACSEDPTANLGEMDQRRWLRLEGAPNFRDLGGYRTADGRTVRWEILYRSDHLGDLTDEDVARFSQLGIRMLCDFRGADEKAEDPDRLPETSAPEVVALEISDPSFSPSALREKLTNGNGEEIDFRKLLIDANRMFATRFAPQYRALFERITRPEYLPALVHCTGGKDRAGFASALILRILGVPEEVVFEDYLLTNVYTADKIERTLLLIDVFSLFQADTDAIRPALGVERAFLAAAFAAIDEEYGSFDDYRREALALDDAQVAAFRDLALE